MGRASSTLMPGDRRGSYSIDSSFSSWLVRSANSSSSLKIEGRTKSHFYAARTAQLYKQAILDAEAGKPFDKQLMDELEGLANRGYTEGFYRRHVPAEYQSYEDGTSKLATKRFVGEIKTVNREACTAVIDVKNKFEVGDQLELMTPMGNHVFTLMAMHHAKNHQATNVAPGSGHEVVIPMPEGIDVNTIDEFALLMRVLPEFFRQPSDLTDSASS